MISVSSPRRMVLTDVCENTCSYCPDTGGRFRFKSGADAANVPAATGPAILSCNSLYADSLPTTLNDHFTQNLPVTLEVNLATASLARWREKLLSLQNPLLSLIVVIDKWHPQKIASLAALDHSVREYRVLPSKLYPMELFEKELPPFVLKKRTWAFVTTSKENSPFLASADLYDRDITAVSNTQFYQGAHITVTPIGDSSLWISAAGIAPDAAQMAELEKQTAWLRGDEVFWFASASDRALTAAIRKHRKNSHKDFYLLENTLVSRELWGRFLSSGGGQLTDSFSWSEFVCQNKINVSLTMSTLSSGKMDLNEFALLCQRRFARQPENDFFEDFFCLFSPRPQWRSFQVKTFKTVNGKLGLGVPPKEQLQSSLAAFLDAYKNRHLEVSESENVVQRIIFRERQRLYWARRRAAWLMYQLFCYIQITFSNALYEADASRRTYFFTAYWTAHKLAWRTYHLFWHSYYAVKAEAKIRGIHFYWRCNDLFWRGYDVFWRIMDAYWWFYSRFIAPVVGFSRSLFEYPSHWRYEPFPRRLKLKAGVFVKKWGWLALKILGRR